jgi:hypothetical protein
MASVRGILNIQSLNELTYENRMPPPPGVGRALAAAHRDRTGTVFRMFVRNFRLLPARASMPASQCAACA